MDRTIASVAVWPVFLVHLKFSFWKDVVFSRVAAEVAWTLLSFSSVLLVETFESFSWCCCPKKEKKTIKTTEQLERKSDPVGLLLQNAEFVWHPFNLLDFFCLFVYDVHECGVKSCMWHSIGGQLICGGNICAECGEKETGCTVSVSAISTPLALRIALQPQFIFFLFSYYFQLSWNILCVKGKKKTALPFWIFISQSLSEHKQWGKRN